MRYEVVILAAGQASRMGRCKALLPLSDAPDDHALSRLARLWADAPACRVVTGFHAVAVEAACAALGLETVRNPRPEDGMFSSVRAGLAGVRDSSASTVDGVFLHPVDVPLVRPLTVIRLREAAVDFPGAALIPTFAGTEGHPVFLPAALLSSILEAKGASGLRAVLAGLPLRHVPVPDALMTRDMDRPEDYATLCGLAAATDSLSAAEAEEWLHLRETPQRGLRHARAVGTVALALARALARARRLGGAADVPLPDAALCFAAGLLHDICKGEADHEAAGARLLARYGLPRLAAIVGAHRDMTPVPPAALTERELVFLADKHCRGGDWVSVAQRFDAKLALYVGDAAACAAIAGRKARALEMEAALAEALSPLARAGEEADPARIAREALGMRGAHAEDIDHEQR